MRVASSSSGDRSLSQGLWMANVDSPLPLAADVTHPLSPGAEIGGGHGIRPPRVPALPHSWPFFLDSHFQRERVCHPESFRDSRAPRPQLVLAICPA